MKHIKGFCQMFNRQLMLALVALLTLIISPAARADAPPIIAAASDLQFALDEIAQRFEAETGQAVKPVYGSTGNFARQIREGAPFQMFMAADESYVRDLAAEGLTRDAGMLYGEGRLVMLVPTGAELAADGTLDGLRAALAAGRITRFAIANPEHAPMANAPKRRCAMPGCGIRSSPIWCWGKCQPSRPIRPVRQRRRGIVAYSLALSPNLAGQGQHDLIPADWHDPLLQRMVLLKEAGPVAEAFYRYVAAPSARAILERYGFALPKE
ncbi:molybdate ABC transporter substrate-binding protein [Gemmobacter lanyuensis]